MKLREWIIGGAVLLNPLSSVADEFKASGIVERVEPGIIVLNISSDNCSGSHKLILKNAKIEGNISKGRKIFFKASGNPCIKEKVYLLEIRSMVFEEAEHE